MLVSIFILFFLNLQSQSTCLPGNSESTNPTTSEKKCSPCQAGKYSPPDSTMCKDCPIGYYTKLSEQADCPVKFCSTEISNSKDYSSSNSLKGKSNENVTVLCAVGYVGGGVVTCSSSAGNIQQIFTNTACNPKTCRPTEVPHSDKSSLNSIIGIQTGNSILITCNKEYWTDDLEEATGLSFCKSDGIMSLVICQLRVDDSNDGTYAADIPPAPTTVRPIGGEVNGEATLSPSSMEELDGTDHWVVIVGLFMFFAGLFCVAAMIIHVVHKHNVRRHEVEHKKQNHAIQMLHDVEMSSIKNKRGNNHRSGEYGRISAPPPPKNVSGWGGKRLAGYNSVKIIQSQKDKRKSKTEVEM